LMFSRLTERNKTHHCKNNIAAHECEAASTVHGRTLDVWGCKQDDRPILQKGDT
jgi:hypothetical protein